MDMAFGRNESLTTIACFVTTQKPSPLVERNEWVVIYQRYQPCDLIIHTLCQFKMLHLRGKGNILKNWARNEKETDYFKQFENNRL